MNNFLLRTATAVVYVALLVGCTVWQPVSAYIFYTLVAFGATLEFCSLMNRHYGAQVNTPIVGFSSAMLVSVAWLLQINGQEGESSRFLVVYGFTQLFLLISELYRQSDNPLRNWALAFAAQFYTALPFALLPYIGIHQDAYTNTPVYEWVYILALFIFLWANDTGAYLVGSMLGRYIPYKLFPRISPNKSWVGSIGGGLLTLAAAWAVYLVRPADLSLIQWLGMALMVVFFGTWGDLVESMLKRQLGIKDSGRVIPGHGGVLDRFDSALLAIPAVALYFLYIL